MPRRSKASIEAGVCTSGRHKWIDGQKRCRECQSEYNKRTYQKKPVTLRTHCKSGKHKWVEGQKQCKACKRLSKMRWMEANPEYNRNYYKDNIERFKEKGQRFKANNPDYFRQYARDHADELNEKGSCWKKENREKMNEYESRRYNVDINYKLAKVLRGRLRSALINNQKRGSAVKDLGCSIPELKEHLERQFQEGMTWDNYGEWHIDHIVPLSVFDLTDREQLLKACHYTNLQPLWAADNLSKGASYDLDQLGRRR